jgi:hypothetical protein
VIEVKHQDVGFAAINARMFKQVCDETFEILGIVARRIPLGIGDICGAITFVVPAVPGFVARAAKTVAPAMCFVLEAELAQRF